MMGKSFIVLWIDGYQEPFEIFYTSIGDRDSQIGKIISDNLSYHRELITDSDSNWYGYSQLSFRMSPPLCPVCWDELDYDTDRDGNGICDVCLLEKTLADGAEE